MDLGAARNLSAVQEDIHDLAGLAGAVRALQRAAPTAGLAADPYRAFSLAGGAGWGWGSRQADTKRECRVDRGRGVFCCGGGGRGGDGVRFVEIVRGVSSPQAWALLPQWRVLPPLFQEAGVFYRVQLHRH